MLNELNAIRENFLGVVKMKVEITALGYCISYISHLTMYWYYVNKNSIF